MSSYSPEVTEDWNDPNRDPQVTYVKCHACYGSGQDRHGRGDCLECEGYGDIECNL